MRRLVLLAIFQIFNGDNFAGTRVFPQQFERVTSTFFCKSTHAGPPETVSDLKPLG